MPRLVSATCPQCGAALRIGPRDNVITCAYCQKSSFVHFPNQMPMPPPPTQVDYGHIHLPVQPSSGNPAAVVLVFAIVIVVLLGGLIPVCLLIPSRSSRTYTSSPEVTVVSTSNATTSPFNAPGAAVPGACDKAVRCCKAVMDSGDSRACEGLRVMSDADCAKQVESFAMAARSKGRKCD